MGQNNENIDGFGGKLAMLKISLSIVSSSTANTGGLGYCPSIFCPIKKVCYTLFSILAIYLHTNTIHT